MGKKIGILILVVVVLAAGIAAFFYVRNANAGDSRLQGDWTEVNSQSPDTFTIRNNQMVYAREDGQKTYAFSLEEGESYNLGLEDALTVCFDQGDGPWFGDLVYHTQEVDGHTIHILDAFMYEDDGRGLIVGNEFVRSDDLQYVGPDFTSALYDELNRSEAVPTYVGS